jgi:transcriptional regulator with XRE-family HTH domain
MSIKQGKNLREILADNVRTNRKQKGLSQEDLADLCGLHRTYIGAIERAEQNVTLRTLESLASSLGVSPVDLLTRKDSRNAKQ